MYCLVNLKCQWEKLLIFNQKHIIRLFAVSISHFSSFSNMIANRAPGSRSVDFRKLNDIEDFGQNVRVLAMRGGAPIDGFSILMVVKDGFSTPPKLC